MPFFIMFTSVGTSLEAGPARETGEVRRSSQRILRTLRDFPDGQVKRNCYCHTGHSPIVQMMPVRREVGGDASMSRLDRWSIFTSAWVDLSW